MSSHAARRLRRATPPDATDSATGAEPERRPKMRARRGDKAQEDVCNENERTRGNENGGERGGQQTQAAEAAETDEVTDVSALHGFELLLDVKYSKNQWAEARVLDLDVQKREVFVHYMGWNARYDAWVKPKLIAAHGSHTKAKTKKDASWDGVRSLFERAERPTGGFTKRRKSKQRSSRRSTTPKGRADKRKRRGSACSVTSSGSRSESTLSSPQSTAAKKPPIEDAVTKKVRDVATAAAAVDVAPRRTRSSKPNAKSTERAGRSPGTLDIASPSSPSAVDANGSSNVSVSMIEDTPLAVAAATAAAAPIEVTEETRASRTLRRRPNEKRRGRGRKGKEDVSSESEYSDHGDSDMEEEDDASDEEELRRLRKRRKQRDEDLSNDDGEEEEGSASDEAVKNKRQVTRRSERRTGNAKTHPLPRSAPRVSVPWSGDKGATREHLAAIFRQRVYQQQLMQVTQAEMRAQPYPAAGAAPVAPAPSPPAPAPAASRARSRRGSSRNGSKASTTASTAAATPVVGLDPQLAAYYHYHNMMMAQAYMTADPKEIQERLRAIEQQRAAHVQAYYKRLEATRAQNAQSMDAAQGFVDKSASAWQQQSLAVQPRSEDSSSSDSAPLKDWSDMSKSLETKGEKPCATGDGDSSQDAVVKELVDAKGATKPSEKHAAVKLEGKAPSGDLDVPRGDILYEFVL